MVSTGATAVVSIVVAPEFSKNVTDINVRKNFFMESVSHPWYTIQA